MNQKMTIFVVLLCFFCGASCRAKSYTPPAKNGVIVAQEYFVSNFTRIECEFFEIKLHKAQNYRVVATMDSNLLQYADIHVKNDKLYIYNKYFNRHKHISFNEHISADIGIWDNCIIDIYTPMISELKAGGMSDVTELDDFNMLEKISLSGISQFQSDAAHTTLDIELADMASAVLSGSGTTVKARLRGAAKINSDITHTTLDIELADMASAVLSGSGATVKARLSGTTKFDGYNFSVKSATVTMKDMADAQLNVVDSLEAYIVDFAKISYKGSPKIVNTNSPNIKKIE